MADTIRTDPANITNLANNTAGAISAQDMRDIYVSLAARAGFRFTTSAGTAQAQTLSTGLDLNAWAHGLSFSFVSGFNTTGADPTIKIDNLAVRTMTHRDGSAFRANALRAGVRYNAEYDGTLVRVLVLNAGGWMDQTSYDLIWPVHGPLQIRRDDVDPNTQLPAGITATWTEITSTFAYGMAFAVRAAAAVATSEGSSSTTLPDHTHVLGGSGTPGVPNQSGSQIGVSTNPAIEFDIRRFIVRAWRRSA